MRFDYLRVSGTPSKPEKNRWYFRKQADISLNSSPRSENDFALSASTSSGQTGSGDIEARSILRQGCYTSTNATRPILLRFHTCAWCGGRCLHIWLSSVRFYCFFFTLAVESAVKTIAAKWAGGISGSEAYR